MDLEGLPTDLKQVMELTDSAVTAASVLVSRTGLYKGERRLADHCADDLASLANRLATATPAASRARKRVELELLSTSYYVLCRFPGAKKDTQIREVRRLKPRFSRKQTADALNEAVEIADAITKA